MRLARRRRGSRRAFARFVSAIFRKRSSRRSPPLVFRRTYAPRSVASVGFRFKGESHGGAHFSRLRSPRGRLDGRSAGCRGAKKRRRGFAAPRSTLARLPSANANFRIVIRFILKRSDFRSAKSMGGQDV